MLLRELWVTNEYGKTSTIDPNTQEEISFVGKLDLIEYNNNKCCYGLKTVNSPSLIDDQINSDMLPAKIIIPQNITPPRIGSKIIVFIEGIDHYMSDYLQGYKSQSAPGFVPGINLGQLSESLNEKADRDLQNLNSTGTNKFSDPDLSNLSDDGKNITNWSSNATNCVTEIPQDIKLELNDGTLTLKAGSKVYVPNGFEADGTTPKFDVVTIESDISDPADTNRQAIITVANNSLFVLPTEFLTSGTVAPTNFYASEFAVWYDTTNNKIKTTSNGGVTWYEDASFPICEVTETTTSYSIDQIFNGFGYIGSTVFVLPGVKVQIPNGRNEYGTYVNNIEKITSVKTNIFTSESGSVDLYYNSDIKSIGAVYAGTYIYDSFTNSYMNKSTGLNVTTLIKIANCICTSGKISSFKFADVDSVANSNASNFSQAGRSEISRLASISKRGIQLTLGADGSQYVMPANGRLCLKTEGGSCQIYVNASEHSNMIIYSTSGSGAGTWDSVVAKVTKGDLVTIYYSGSNQWFYLAYDNGDQ